MSAVLFLLGLSFGQQLIIAAVSASLTGIITGIFAYIVARYVREARDQVTEEARANREGIDQIKGGLGLDKRATDKPQGDE
jgi:hypothetical protein